MLDDNTILELKDKYARHRLFLAETPEGDFVLRSPTKAELKKFIDDQENSKSAAMQSLVENCTVYPDRAALNKLLESDPGFLLQFSKKIQDLTVVEDLQGKKL